MNEGLAGRVLASMRCGVVAVDGRGRVTMLNEPAAACLDVEPRASVGRDCREVFARSPALAHLLLDAMERGTLPDRAELEINIAEARRLLIGFSLSRIEDDHGRPVGSAIFFKDLTLVEEEREREALRNRLASLGEVAAQLAHELRNLLGGVRLFVGLARRRLDADPEGQGYLDRAEDELLEANRKMGEVLNFVRPLTLDLSVIDPHEVCRGALEATLARYPGAETEVRWEIESPLPLIRADGSRLRDALANIFANAVEAMEGRGSLRIRLRPEQTPVLVASPLGSLVEGLRGFGEGIRPRVRVEISDDGPGMTPEVLRRIFHPFFTTKEKGSGLGVPAAQKILDAHGGSLDVKSEPGVGTTFMVLVPAITTEGELG